MDDYIKAAVELADGWQPYDDGLMMPNGITQERPQQFALDALAAQLVRQVDDTDSAWIEYGSMGSATMFNGDGDKPCSVWDGSDRTMNTIKAIVDSMVL